MKYFYTNALRAEYYIFKLYIYLHKQEQTRITTGYISNYAGSSNMETAGVEPASENIFTRLSPGAAVCQNSLSKKRDCALFGKVASFVMHGSKLCRCHGHRFNDALHRYAVTPGRTDALNEASFAAVRLLLNYLQRLNLKFRILKRLRSATRLSCFNIPVEALTPPNLFQNIGGNIICTEISQFFGILR